MEVAGVFGLAIQWHCNRLESGDEGDECNIASDCDGKWRGMWHWCRE